jgi:hypothetical protein
MSPAKNAPSSVLASKSPARSPAPAKFAARSLDDAEEARIKKSNAKAAAAAAPSSGAGGGGALKALMFTLGTAALGGAWYYALVLNDPDAPMDVLGLTIETREDRVLIMIAVTFLFICSPLLSAYFHWLWDHKTEMFFNILAWVLGTLNIVALLILLIEPYLPSADHERSGELCFDLTEQPPAISFDHAGVAAGPCFEFGMRMINAAHLPEAEGAR